MNYKNRYQSQLNKYNRLKEKYRSVLAEKESIEVRYSESLKTVDMLNQELFETRLELDNTVAKANGENDKCKVFNRRMGKILKDIEREFHKRYEAKNG